MSTFVVSARKYRPIKFEDVVGQNHIAKTLKNALQTDKLAHAFLFCGPRGVGKTTCARILAKVINCLNPIDQVAPCNTCSSCTSFNENASFNIIELDAASNNSVEHIRTLIEQVRFQPQQGSHKVFIIDEVHMLSTQAFNAFLKTLEEPPPYAIFILATTEKHKILPTILSRCQIFDFKRIQVGDIVEQLQRILKSEGRTADVEALHQIGQKADGGMRDALSIFDKVASAVEGNITYKDIIQHLNVLDYEYFFKTTDACSRGDLKNVFLTIDEVIKNGFEAEHFVQGLSEHMRNLLLSKDTATITVLECSEELRQRYFNQGALATESFILSALDILNTCDVGMPRASNKRLLTELTLSKLCNLHNIIQGSVLMHPQNLQEKKTPDVSDRSAEKASDSQLSPENVIAPQHISEKEMVKVANVTPQESTVVATVTEQKDLLRSGSGPLRNKVADIRKKVLEEEALKAQAQKGFNLESVKNIWNQYLEANPSVSTKTAMKHTILQLDGNNLIITVPNAATKNLIAQEGPIIDRIREEFGLTTLTIELIIDKAQFPDMEEVQIKQTLSTKEVFEHFKSKNEHFTKFITKLELKPDNHHG